MNIAFTIFIKFIKGYVGAEGNHTKSQVKKVFVVSETNRPVRRSLG